MNSFLISFIVVSICYLFKYRNEILKFFTSLTTSTSNFEGAGFTFIYKDNVILVTRLKKEKDLAKDPTKEVEYIGGKVEEDETPIDTAFAELVEELGGNPLEDDWSERAVPITTWQPFSQKWIWNYLLILTDTEYEKLQTLDVALDNWDSEELKDFRTITGRSEASRKAVEAICVVDKNEFLEYVRNFENYGSKENRMKDAKAYGNDENTRLFTVHRVSDSTQTFTRRLRGFNLVIIEQHLSMFEAMLNPTQTAAEMEYEDDSSEEDSNE